LVKLDGVEQPVRLLERLGVVGDIVITGVGTSRSLALVVPGALIDVVSTESSVDDLNFVLACYISWPYNHLQ
jgi:hypothetical protein